MELSSDSSFVQSHRATLVKALRDFWLLLQEQLMALRTIWPWYFFVQTIVPLGFVFAFGHYAGTTPSREVLVNIVSGSITFTLVYLGLSSMAAKIAAMWQAGTLLYYYSLPLNKISLVTALLCSRMLVLLPSLVVPVLGARLIYQVDFHLDLWLIIIVAFGTFTLAVAGAAIGSWLKNGELASILTNALVFIVMLASPAFIPVAALPLPLQLLGWLLPTTYISDALSHALTGMYDAAFFGDILALIVMALLATIVNLRFLVWRID